MTLRNKMTVPEGHFVVDVTLLRSGPVRIETDIPVDWLTQELSFCEYGIRSDHGRVTLVAEPCSGGVLVRGDITTQLVAQCGICLGDTPVAQKINVSTYLFPKVAAAAEAEEAELTPDELDKEWYEGDRIVLDDLVRDHVMLELPMNPRCGDDCPGLAAFEEAAKFKTDPDPRLARLATIDLAAKKEN
ncbi:MAG: DUF177 domain-containing protein [Myxococcota bacterium]|jgi:uncharacterized protein|nr:DUF177 domain-containing protein [Myxococcota bacterium]